MEQRNAHIEAHEIAIFVHQNGLNTGNFLCFHLIQLMAYEWGGGVWAQQSQGPRHFGVWPGPLPPREGPHLLGALPAPPGASVSPSGPVPPESFEAPVPPLLGVWTQDRARASCLSFWNPGEGEGGAAGVLKRCSSRGERRGRPTANRPLTLEPLGLPASLPSSPSHLQTTLAFAEPVCAAASGGGGGGLSQAWPWA